jgi:hypothetical protein
MASRQISLASLAVASLVLATLVASQADAGADDDRYVDRRLGFAFSKPQFTPSEEPKLTTVAVTLSGAPAGGFAPSVNVTVQNLETTLDAYQALQRREMKTIGWELIEQSRGQVGATPSLRTHGRGSLQGLEIEFLAIALIRDEEKVFVLTCTATTAQFPLYQAEFERVASSFVLQR